VLLMAEPIFLMCSERSGSNLITRIFDSHSQYCAPPAIHVLRVLGENLFRYGDLRLRSNWSILVDDLIALFDAKPGIWTIGTKEVEQLASKSACGSLGLLILSLYRAEADAAGKETFFVKENQLYNFAPIILESCQTARFLHLVRDPRDMALSWLQSASLRGGPVRAANVWAADQCGFLRLYSQIAGTRRVARMTYEALSSDAAGSLSRACAALDIAYEPDALSFHRNDRVIANAGEVKDWDNTSRPLMTDNTGKYKSGLRPDQIAYIEATCADLMGLFGYAVSLGKREDLSTLTQRLAAEEPFEKAAYQTVSTVEREQRQQWQTIVTRIRSRCPL
jgi:hypothetical protein